MGTTVRIIRSRSGRIRSVFDEENERADGQRYCAEQTVVPIGVYRNTPGVAGEFEAVNPAMVEMFDAHDESELLDTPVAKLYRTPGQRERFGRTLDREGQIRGKELRLETLDGEPFWAAVTAIRHEIDGQTYYDGIIQEINTLGDEEIARRREAADEGETNRFIFPHELADGEVRQVEVDPRRFIPGKNGCCSRLSTT